MAGEQPQTGWTAPRCAVTLQDMVNRRGNVFYRYFGSPSSQMEDTCTFTCKDLSTLTLCNEIANISVQQSSPSPFLPSSFSMICLLLSASLTCFSPLYLSSTTPTISFSLLLPFSLPHNHYLLSSHSCPAHFYVSLFIYHLLCNVLI